MSEYEWLVFLFLSLWIGFGVREARKEIAATRKDIDDLRKLLKPTEPAPPGPYKTTSTPLPLPK